MAQQVALNHVTHKDLRIADLHGPEYGDNVNVVATFPTEFGDMQRDYPILLRKDEETGEYSAIALLGFRQGENLFLDGQGGWKGSYIPGVLARGPFLIGFQQQQVDGQVRQEPVLHLDLDDPRVGREDGLPLFLPQGGSSPYLQRMAAVMRGIHEGVAIGKAMYAMLDEYGLIEPAKMEVEIHRDERYNFNGTYTISREKLANLDGAALERLNKANFLQGAYLLLSSLGNMYRLIDMRRRVLIAEQQAAAAAAPAG